MSSVARPAVFRQIRALFGSGTVAGLTDGQLLERFMDGPRDAAEDAFSALVARHGPMVRGVCRRALADPNDADDAFQATFLVLVRKARSVRVEESLGRWLYGVSRKVANRARADAHRRLRVDAVALDAIAAFSPDPDRFEASAILDEELARLGEPYRSAVVLCDLAGLTHEEAARDLRCPVGTIKSRLVRGRTRLRERLERRGLNPSALATVPVPQLLMNDTIRAGLGLATMGILDAGMVPASAVALTKGMIKAMTWTKMKVAAAAALSFCVTFGYASWGGDGPPKPAPQVVSPARKTTSVRAARMPDYVVEPPDIITVEVPEALPGRPIGGEHLVRPDGTITLGFYGDVHVANLTTRQIKEKVAIHLRKYLDDKSLGLSRANPETGKVETVEPALSDRIFIELASCNSKWYTVQGEVGNPGRFRFTGNERILDALNLAGGLTGQADKFMIRLLRPAPTPADESQVLPVSLSAMMSRGDMNTNYQIMPGDRLVVYPDAKTDPTTVRDLEKRLQVVEKKLDEILKALERLPKS